MSWDDLLTLSTLMRSGSYSACARELDLTHATVIRRIRRLEQALGKPVVTREDNTFRLTSHGHGALAAALQMEQAVDRLLRETEASGQGVTGEVRIAATAAMGSHYLTPRLPALYRAHPQIEVCLQLGDRITSLAKRRAHIGVRLARPQEVDMVALKVGRVRFGLYGAAAAPASDGQPLCGLTEHSNLTLPEVQWPKTLGRRFAFTANDLLAVRESVRAGLGVALLPHYLADPGLVLYEHIPQVEREIWLAYPTEYRNTERFRPVIAWLAQVLGECP